MVKEFLMKKLLISLGVFACVTVNAQIASESLGIDQTSSFKSELDGYRAQLIDGYMSDKEGEKAAARAVYDRGDHSVELTHILFRLPEKTVSKDTVAVYQEAMRVYERLQKGEDMETVGKALEG